MANSEWPEQPAMLPKSQLAAAQGAWERQIVALHLGRSDPVSGRGLNNKAARLPLDNEQHFDAGWLQLLWQRGFQHSNPQVSSESCHQLW